MCWSWGEEGEAVRGLLEVIHRELGALDAGSGGGGGCCLVVDSLSSLLDLVEAPGDPQGASLPAGLPSWTRHLSVTNTEDVWNTPTHSQEPNVPNTQHLGPNPETSILKPRG